jgi:hypothetical protein
VIHKPDGVSGVVSNSLIPLHYSFYLFSGLASDYYCPNRNALAKRSDVRDGLALHACFNFPGCLFYWQAEFCWSWYQGIHTNGFLGVLQLWILCLVM